MNVRFTSTICLLLFVCSCKSLQPAWHSNSAKSSASPKKKDPRFLDDISVVPGEKKGNSYTYKKPSQKKQVAPYNYNPSFNIETANWLQVKYSIIMDVPVEQLTDLQLLQQIDYWWGTRYCLGGNNESCIDCSAFTQTMLLSVYGINVPRTAQEQYDFSTHIDDSNLSEGDLVFFKSGRYVSHVGLYVGNYKFVHASTSGGVTISDLNDDYWAKKYAGAGRVKPANTVRTRIINK